MSAWNVCQRSCWAWAAWAVLGAPALLAQDFYYVAKPRAVSTGPRYDLPDPAPRMVVAPPAESDFRRDVSPGYAERDLPPHAYDEAPVQTTRRADYQHRGEYQSHNEYQRALPAVAQEPMHPRYRGYQPSGRSRRGPARPEPVSRRPILQTAAQGPTPANPMLDPFGDDPPPRVPGRDMGYDNAYGAGPEEVTGEYMDGGYGDDPRMQGEPFLDEYGQGNCQHCGANCGGTCHGCSFLSGVCNHFCDWHTSGSSTENFSFYTGKQGFKGPVDQGVNGDFGYYGGANWATPLFDCWGIGYQAGVSLVASDFAGRTSQLGSRRTQWFVTSGLFRRAMGNGFQGGAVIDYLNDDFYIHMDLLQIRAELSYVYCHHEVGFTGAFHTNTSTQTTLTPILGNTFNQTFSYQGNNQYNLFYRYEFCTGAVFKTWMGLSSYGDGIFGGDAILPFSPRWAVTTSYNYLLPRNEPDVPNNVKESWNLSIGLVWYPFYRPCGSVTNPYRPLFPVADNGTFFVRQAN